MSRIRRLPALLLGGALMLACSVQEFATMSNTDLMEEARGRGFEPGQPVHWEYGVKMAVRIQKCFATLYYDYRDNSVKLVMNEGEVRNPSLESLQRSETHARCFAE